jgi:hypothetical protein
VCDGRHVLGLALSVVPGSTAAEKQARGVSVKEEESGMPRTLGRNVPVAVPEHEGEVGAGEGVTPEQHVCDLGLGHVTILKALFDADNQDRIHRPPTALPRTSGRQCPPMNLDWTKCHPRDGKTVITAIDTHAAGEPLRILTGGLPPLPGSSILDRRRWMREHLDHLRRALMWEPRGHFDMYGCVPTPPVTPGPTWVSCSCTTRGTAPCAATASSR